ncbi:MAG: hypothetical protein HQL28_04915 [Candidatus Omnitrophica bacterium]|nr:hypothetical protein [Candidatus Omnitrophota bacterium]
MKISLNAVWLLFAFVNFACAGQEQTETNAGKETEQKSATEETAPTIDLDMMQQLASQLQAAGVLDKKLTDAEVALYAKYPDRWTRITDITTYAKVTAKEIASENKDVSEDAYRHILWAYLLTKEYGKDFAKEVVDAHEIGDNSESEKYHQQAYANNAVGTEYALKGYKEDELADRMEKDNRVMMYADNRDPEIQRMRAERLGRRGGR